MSDAKLYEYSGGVVLGKGSIRGGVSTYTASCYSSAEITTY